MKIQNSSTDHNNIFHPINELFCHCSFSSLLNKVHPLFTLISSIIYILKCDLSDYLDSQPYKCFLELVPQTSINQDNPLKLPTICSLLI
jgi:hypothetical protein